MTLLDKPPDPPSTQLNPHSRTVAAEEVEVALDFLREVEEKSLSFGRYAFKFSVPERGLKGTQWIATIVHDRLKRQGCHDGPYRI